MNSNHFVVSIVLLLALADLLVLARMHAIFRNSPGRKWRRAFLAFWMLAAAGFCVLIFFEGIVLGSTRDPVPRSLVSMQFIWHFLLLPIVVISLLIEGTVQLVRWAMRRKRSRATPTLETSPAISPSEPLTPQFSRRQFLASATLVAAPITTAGLTSVGLSQIGKFRVRTFDVAVNHLPPALENYSITVIADVHVGVFSTPKMLSDIVEASNRLQSNLVLLPGR